MKKAAGTLGYIIFRVILMVAVIAIVAAGSSFIHSHSGILRNTKDAIDLNEIINNGEDFPEGEYVKLRISFPVGCYAENTSSLTVGDSNSGFESGKDYYYMIMLDDYTLMSVKVSDQGDVDDLESFIDHINEAGDSYVNDGSDYVELAGKLTTLTDSQVLQYYYEMLEYMELDRNEDYARTYLLDATAVPGCSILIIVAVIAAVIAAFIIFSAVRKKKKAQTAAQAQNVPWEQ